MDILKVTIDTNLIIYLLDENTEDKNFLVSANILRTILEAKILLDVKITTSLEGDLKQDIDLERKEKMLNKVQNIFSCIGAVNINQELLNELRMILFPSLKENEKRFQNKMNDMQHLAKHIINKRDIFVTNDNDFIKKNDELKSAFSVQVMSPEDFLSYVDSLNDTKDFKHKRHPKRTDYYSKDLSGIVEFDFTNNDNIFTIGSGDFIFETSWSSCSNERMYIYNDPINIEKLAIVEDEEKFKNIKSEYNYDFTSRCRSPRKNKDLIILKNSKGYYAAIRILDIKNNGRGDDHNLLEFEYLIETKGECSFK